MQDEQEPLEETSPEVSGEAEPLPAEEPCALETETEADAEPGQDAEAALEPEVESASEAEPAAEPEGMEEAEPEAAPAGEPTPDPEIEVAPSVVRIPWWPFVVLIVLWLALSGGATYLLTRSTDVPAYGQEWYPHIVLAGVVLTVLGPVLAGITWTVVRADAPAHERSGLLVHSVLRAAVITFVGVLAWWGALVLADALRLGLVDLNL